MRIAFGYKARSGKDTSADYLARAYGGERLAFAQPLYDILQHAQRTCGFPDEKDRAFLH